jgi:hypothetical protein
MSDLLISFYKQRGENISAIIKRFFPVIHLLLCLLLIFIAELKSF